MRAIPERLRGVFKMRRYTNPRLPLPLPCRYLAFHVIFDILLFKLVSFALLTLNGQSSKSVQSVAYVLRGIVCKRV